MVKNITKLSFSNYGVISSTLFEDLKMDNLLTNSKIITSFELDSFYIDRINKTVIDIEKGTGLLYTYTPGKESKTFSLDKCVILNPCVFYKVIPLYYGCIIKIKYNNKTTVIQKNNTNVDFSPAIRKSLKIDKIYTLFYQEFDETFSFKGEKHDFWELTYVDQGELLTLIDEKKFILRQGDYIFYTPNQYHTQKNNTSSPVSFLTICFNLDFKQENIFKDTILNCTHDLKSILKDILYEKDYYGNYSEDLIICYLKEFIIKSIRLFFKKTSLTQLHSSMQENTNNALVNLALDYIYTHTNEKITINKLANKVSISPSYLSRIFKDVMGVTIIDYVNNYRLEKSKEYIKSTELSLTQIAEILGFSSIHYFSKQFKKRYNVSPLIYSKSLKK